MKIIIIDRDQLVSQMITSKIQSDEIVVVEENVKNDAIEKISQEPFDVVIMDPTPLKDAQAMILNIRRVSRTYPYIIVMGEDIDTIELIQNGANNAIEKPVDTEKLKRILSNIAALNEFSGRLSNTEEDFPSAGGVISKSAFNQLFLSSIDRGWRYAENAHVLSVSIENYKEIQQLDGDFHANYGASKLAHHLVKLRRQSDIIGQTGVNEFSLLLQRVANETEAEDAAKRFATSLDEINDFIPPEGNALKIRVSLLALPTGKSMFDQTILKQAA